MIRTITSRWSQAVLLSALMVFAVLGCSAGSRVERRDILLITVEALRSDVMEDETGAVQGQSMMLVAARGVRFRQAYAQIPLTVPSLATILTGSYPQTHGCREAGKPLDQGKLLVQQLLGKGGYSTAAFLGGILGDDSPHGLERGFQQAHIWGRPRRGLGESGGAGGPPLRRLDAEDTLGQTRHNLGQATQWLEKTSGPRFVWLHLGDPWGGVPRPWEPGGVEPADYYRAASALDLELANWLSSTAAGILDRGMVVLAGVQGRHLGEGKTGYGYGGDLKDASLHVPLAVAAPGMFTAGEETGCQVRLLDLMPTILEFAGLGPEPGCQGRSLGSAAAGDELDRPVFAETLAVHPVRGVMRVRAVRYPPHKLLHEEGQHPRLYYLDRDPLENTDVSAQNPVVANQLQSLLHRFLRGEEPLPGMVSDGQ